MALETGIAVFFSHSEMCDDDTFFWSLAWIKKEISHFIFHLKAATSIT